MIIAIVTSSTARAPWLHNADARSRNSEGGGGYCKLTHYRGHSPSSIAGIRLRPPIDVGTGPGMSKSTGLERHPDRRPTGGRPMTEECSDAIHAVDLWRRAGVRERAARADDRDYQRLHGLWPGIAGRQGGLASNRLRPTSAAT